MNIFGCLSSHRRSFGWFLTSIQFVWVYGLHTFLHIHSHISTHSHWTRPMRIIDDDEVGLKEKPFDSEMRSKALGVCGKLQLFCFPFVCWGGGGVIIFIMWRECGKTKTILFPMFMLGRDNTIYNGPPTRPHFLWYVG